MRDRGAMKDVRGFEGAGRRAADILLSSSSVLIIGHIDADGITATSIAAMALKRAGIEHQVIFAKKLDDAVIDRVSSRQEERLWFVDLGSAVASRLDGVRCIITDHHRPDPSEEPERNEDGHVNPHKFSIDGSSEISGSGVTYLVAKMMDRQNRDLSPLAVVGAVGDFQESAHGRLVGYNRYILDDAVSTGLLRVERDVRLFGRETRTLPSFLIGSSDPSLLPFIVRDRGVVEEAVLDDDLTIHDEIHLACIDFIKGAGVEPCLDGRFRTWNLLTREEKRVLVSALVNRIIDSGRGLTMVQRLIGETYGLAPDLPGAPAGWTSTIAPFPVPSSDGRGLDGRARAVLDAKEFASLLNACGRHDRPELGMAICLGDRGEGLMEGCRQQEDHRQRLRNAVQLIRVDPISHITTINGEGRALAAIQYFHAQDRVEDTILGTVVGILMGTPDVLTDRPLVGLTQSSDGACTIKVSARGTRALTAQGLDLSAAMHRAAKAVGGMGGGHNIAAGATIPEGKETEFLDAMDQIVMEQLIP